jgi:hypothetical protein
MAGQAARIQGMEEGKQETTVAFWDARAGHALTSEEDRQIKENLTGFFEVLAEWQRKEDTDAL